MPDQITAYVRTYWPVAMGIVAGLLVTWLAKHVGITVNGNVMAGIVSAVCIALVYAGGRFLERRKSPLAQAVGRWLISAGRDLGQPTYTPSTPDVR